VMLFACELFPKTLFRIRPNVVSRFSAFILWPINIILYPFSRLLGMVSGGIINLLGDTSRAGQYLVSREEIQLLADAAMKEGILDAGESLIINKVMKFGATSVRELMTPVREVKAIDIEVSLDEARGVAAGIDQPHLPVYRGSRYNIIGTINVLRLLNPAPAPSLKNLVETPLIVGEDTLADDLLVDMRASGKEVAVVKGKSGKVKGLVNRSDLIGELIGTPGR